MVEIASFPVPNAVESKSASNPREKRDSGAASSARFGDLIPGKDREAAPDRRAVSRETQERRTDAPERRENRAPHADQVQDRERPVETDRPSERPSQARDEVSDLKSSRANSEAEKPMNPAEQKPGSVVESTEAELALTDKELELAANAAEVDVASLETVEPVIAATSVDATDPLPNLAGLNPDSDVLDALMPLIAATTAPKTVADQPVATAAVTGPAIQTDVSAFQGAQPAAPNAVAATATVTGPAIQTDVPAFQGAQPAAANAGIEGIKAQAASTVVEPVAIQPEIAAPLQDAGDVVGSVEPASSGVTKHLPASAEALAPNGKPDLPAPAKDPSAIAVFAAQAGLVRPSGSIDKANADVSIANAAGLDAELAEAAGFEANPGSPAQPVSTRTGPSQPSAMAMLRGAEFAPPAFTPPVSGQPAAITAPVSLAGAPGLAGKSGEAKGVEGLQQSATPGADLPKPQMPKLAFAEWIQDFAAAHGATHRSGDLVGSLDRAVNGLATPHAGQDALRPTPLQMLPIEVGMQALRGVTKFQIRLDPAELGRVDVKLEIREDGEVKASLVVDRVETLAMLKRDAHTLQQAFEQAGLRQSPDGLNFSLRGESQNQQNAQRQAENARGASWKEDGLASNDLPPELVMRRVMIPNSSLDLII
jgi:flagellar hook-length control protein FliK